MSKIKIKRALISVSDKSGLIDFARRLSEYQIEILSTGGTLKALKDAGIPAIPVEEVTRFPEMMEGRVKTLHPKIHGGLLYRRDKKSHCDEADLHGIEAIDLVVVNLYPFEKVTLKPDVELEEAIENIDIGGPSMLRSAAKNADAVTVVADPEDYGVVLESMEKNDGAVEASLRTQLALKVFQRTASYDRAIASFLESKVHLAGETEKTEGLPPVINPSCEKYRDLRYGENPHQRAAVYIPQGTSAPKHFDQLHGKELSYNNLLDIEAALEVLREFTVPAACVIKHSNPCGIASAKEPVQAILDAVAGDPVSAFGGIVGVNRVCDLKTAQTAFEKLSFFEVMVAPSYESQALEFLKQRKNLRLIEAGKMDFRPGLEYRYLKSGGMLVQDEDPRVVESLDQFEKELNWVTQTKLQGDDLSSLIFAFQCVKVVKSNAIVLALGTQTVGIGAGQMSRVDSVEIACRKAGERTRGALMGSDAFFPMPDSIEIAHQYGIKGIIQPGGSIRDNDVIAACNRHGIAMALTGRRHFKH